MQKNSFFKKLVSSIFNSASAAALLMIIAALLSLVSVVRADDAETQDAYEEGYPSVQHDWNTGDLTLGYNSARGPELQARFFHRSGMIIDLLVVAGYGEDAANKSEGSLSLGWNFLLGHGLSLTIQGRFANIDARDQGFVDPAITAAPGGFLALQTWLGGFSGGVRYTFTNAEPPDYHPWHWAARWDKFLSIGGGLALTASVGTELVDNFDPLDLEESHKIGGGGGFRWFPRWFSGAFWQAQAGSQDGGYWMLGIGYSSSGASSYIKK